MSVEKIGNMSETEQDIMTLLILTESSIK